MAESKAPVEDSGATQAAYREGYRRALAVAALAMSLVAFLNVGGLEKAILAGVLGILALRGTGTRKRGLAVAAVVLASLYVVTLIVLLIVYSDKILPLVR